MRTLPEILEEITQRSTVFLVSMGNASEAGGVISSLVFTLRNLAHLVEFTRLAEFRTRR